MFVCPVPKISLVMMNWCRRASHLCRFTLWNNGRRATQLGRFTLWNYGRLATQLSRFTLWHNRSWASQPAGKFTLWYNGRRAKQPKFMHAPGERFGRFIKHRSIVDLQQTLKYVPFTKIQHSFKRWTIYEDRIADLNKRLKDVRRGHANHHVS